MLFSVALQSYECAWDRFSVSPAGDKTLAGADVYCGTRTFTVVSHSNRITMGLNAPYFSKGGRFKCTLTATVPSILTPPRCDCGWKKQVQKLIITSFYEFLGFEVLTAVVMKSTVFWDITPCSPLKVNRRFRGIYPKK
jgi:hypothetical protein